MDLGVDPSPSRVGAASPGSSCRSPTWRGRAGIVLLESEDCARRRGHIGSLDIRVRRSSLTGITPRQADLSRRRGGVARAEVAGGRAEVAGPGPATCVVDSRGVEKRPLGRRLLSSALEWALHGRLKKAPLGVGLGAGRLDLLQVVVRPGRW